MRKRYIKLISLFMMGALLLGNASAADISSGKRIGAGYDQSLFVDPSGTVWGWGDASIKGDGVRPEPIMTGVQSVFGGKESHTNFVIRKDGSLWGWGSTYDGELGVISSNWIKEPVQLLPSVKSIEAGRSTLFALKPDGSLWAWGYHGEQRGDSSKKNWTRPRKIFDKVKLVSSSMTHTLALREDGSLWAWGYNLCGSLGDGTKKTSLRPRRVNLKNLQGRKIVNISNNIGDSFAVTEDGLLWRWGERHYFHQWCIDDIPVLIPTLVKEIEGVQEAAAMWYGMLILKKDGTVWEWGTNGRRPWEPPRQVMSHIQEIAVGYGHYVVLGKDGTVWAWGWNRSGQLGDGTTNDRKEPQQVIFPK